MSSGIVAPTPTPLLTPDMQTQSSGHQASLESYSIPPYKRMPYKGRILLSDILGRRRPVGFVREFYPIRGGTR
jgi:hypothetical protein